MSMQRTPRMSMQRSVVVGFLSHTARQQRLLRDCPPRCLGPEFTTLRRQHTFHADHAHTHTLTGQIAVVFINVSLIFWGLLICTREARARYSQFLTKSCLNSVSIKCVCSTNLCLCILLYIQCVYCVLFSIPLETLPPDPEKERKIYHDKQINNRKPNKHCTNNLTNNHLHNHLASY